ncbi:MAG: DNA/RNA non-specific endonuclease [Prevotella sp.]|nr:DNA/RNA non-specific endonuclease [Prevotella sp.]
MKKTRIFLLFLTAILTVACNDDDKPTADNSSVNVNRNDTSKEPALQRLEFPKVKGGDSRVIIHSLNDEFGINYSVEWDTKKRSQRWSCYQMTASNRVSKTSRYYSDTNQYPYDPELKVNEYFSYDPFRGSGYDHGHICPSADRLYSKDANYQTFYLTNMQPQYHVFNAGIWEIMEGKLRSWIHQSSNTKDTLFVCKGGTIDSVETAGGVKDPILTTLKNGLIVPKYFYMALLYKSKNGSYKALAFWVEHKNEDHSNDPLSKYVINIDELERLTGIDFFCNLPDDIENEVEGMSVEDVKWLWTL